MLLESLTLHNFRNYVHLALDVPKGHLILQGENAQGKSNLLEGMSFLATGKSLRAASDREVINWLVLRRAEQDGAAAEAFSKIEASVAKGDRLVHAQIAIIAGSRSGIQSQQYNVSDNAVSKTLVVDGLPRRALDFVGEVNVVIFSPEDIELVAGPPAVRRRYLDVTCSQISRTYLRSLQRYARAVSQRNSLLRQVREGIQRASSLESWEEQMAANGAVVLAERHAMLSAMRSLASEKYQAMAGNSARLDLRYHSTAAGSGRTTQSPLDDHEPDPADLRQGFLHVLQQTREREIAAGVSLLGPHRDNLTFLLDGVDLTVYGSRGEQRLTALAMKLAETEYIQSRTEHYPILLLDDMLSELDTVRRQYLQRTLQGAQQVIMTCCDLQGFDLRFLAGATLMRVQNGVVTPLSL